MAELEKQLVAVIPVWRNIMKLKTPKRAYVEIIGPFIMLGALFVIGLYAWIKWTI